ncbi:MAG: DUF642 domain-containing protein [Acidobacteriales bacterium]|nr:DUF642 domain-containing protein [Terriglobales bacterium]
MRRIALQLMIGALLLAVSGLATPIPITNAGFDANTPPNATQPWWPVGYTDPFQAGSCTVACISPWTLTSGNVDWVSSSVWAAHNGSWSIDLNGNTAGAITIDLGNQAAGTYDLSFWMSRNPLSTAPVDMSVIVTGLSPSTFSYSGAAGQYALQTQSFAWGGGTMSITFQSSVASGGYGPVMDDVSLSLRDEGVPEPGTLWTLLTGAGLLAGAMLLRKKI